MFRKMAVVLVIVSGVGLLATLGNANAQVVDPAVKACLEKSIGVKATNKIIAAKKLTKAQTAQVKACTSTSNATGTATGATTGSTSSTTAGMVSLNYVLLSYIGSNQSGLGNISDPALLQVGNKLRMFFKNGNESQIGLSGFDNKIHSYVSSDNGKTWALESGIKIDAGSPVSVQAASTGGYEAWGWVLSPNADKMTKFTSSDGETFSAGSGSVPVLNSCKNVNGVAATKFGDFQVIKLSNGTFLAFAQDSNNSAPFMRHACGFTSPDGITWTLDAAKTVALQNDIQTNPETYRNSSGAIEQILPVDKLDPSTNLRTGLQFRTSTNDGVSWSDFSELSFFAADPDRLDLSNGDSLLAFGGFDHGQGGLLAVAKKSATNYKASRTENFLDWVTWTISGASQSDIKIRNLCTNKDLTSSVKFSTSGSNISVTYTAPAGGKGNSCVYALVGSEQAIK
ncbi:MAG: hypothetical protein F2712_04755 [Actinobacteria bacterium]|uniref:Unannotated protein n=1 Tax=freshwater metagenome TaxID=449393 RepID=A0A6J6UWK6_9ZZZZ|nr:hypothetical protein [Actinomycetota bacterium]